MNTLTERLKVKDYPGIQIERNEKRLQLEEKQGDKEKCNQIIRCINILISSGNTNETQRTESIIGYLNPMSQLIRVGDLRVWELQGMSVR